MSDAPRWLYLARHGEATADETALTDNGRRQAALLGRRLRDVPLSAVHHGPLPRAEETATLLTAELDGVPAHRSEAAGDYIPHLPRREELQPDSADTLLAFLAGVTEEEARLGSALAREAQARFTGTVTGDTPRHELVVTHNFLIGWLVRAALDAPPARWLGLNFANAALTVIRYAPDRPPSVVCANDMRHLPDELRWTGFPPEYRF
ncbi:histidine phosphatase family protein [Streptomyces sp. NPDC127033]|uniref:histidine phosphatase family protein n=1 Tax=Streptomyces sp. NPDC127033 TaxID=3347110 RepID=UPI003660410E